MDRSGGNAVTLQLLGQAVGAMLGSGEHQHLLPGIVTHQLAQQGSLLALVHRVNRLLDAFRSGITGGDFHLNRILQQALSQGANLVGEGGGEQQVLTLGRQQRKDLADVADEAHVQHTVGFVQHQDLHFVEANGVLLVQVHQTARCGHQHVYSLAQLHHLRIDFHTTEDHGGLGRNVLAVQIHAVVNLCGQFTGRCQNQRTGALTGARVFSQALQQWQGKAGGFAGTGLGCSHHVLAGQNRRNGLGLDGGRGFITLIGRGTNQLLGQTE